MSDAKDRFHRLVEQLEKLADPRNPNRAVLAYLRRGLGGDSTQALMRAGWLFVSFRDRDEEDAAILTAALFAWAKGKCSNLASTSLGRAFAQLPGAGDNPSIERRFVDLLDTDRAEVDVKLRQVISLLAQHSIGLDWAILGRDILRWDLPDRWVQKQWARDFWRSAVSEPESSPSTETTDA